MNVYIVWDGAPDLQAEERDAFLVVAHDEREAIQLWVGVAQCPENASPRARLAEWGRATEPPAPPAEPCVWHTKDFRGYGLYEIDDPTCDWCGEHADPDEFNRERSVCTRCLEDPAVERDTRVCDCPEDGGHHVGCTDEKPFKGE